jgi:transposase
MPSCAISNWRESRRNALARRVVRCHHSAVTNTIDMRSLAPDARAEMRAEIVRLRKAGLTYLQISAQTGLSRTGVFDICKRYAAMGSASLRDARPGRPSGAVRKLRSPQEALLRQLICDHTPDQLDMAYPLWVRSAVTRLIDLRLGLRLKVRTLGSYLDRWGFSPRQTSRCNRDSSSTRRLWLRKEMPDVAARAGIEDAEINWGDDAPLHVQATPGEGTDPHVAEGDGQRGLTSAVNAKGQMRWKVHVGVLTASELIDFLRRLVKGSPKKVFLVLHTVPALKTPAVKVWLHEHVDEIEVFCQPAEGPRREGASVQLDALESTA